jgi:hypothetical protein
MKKQVAVTQIVEIEVDETKFTPEFMAEFRASMYYFRTIDQHIEHLAQLYARNIADDRSFIEGYGPAADMGIKGKVIDQTEDILNYAIASAEDRHD